MLKRSSQSVSFEVNGSPDEIWDIIGAVGGVDKWFGPIITSCRLEGNKRICGTADGEFEEDILSVDHANKVFIYGIPQQHLLPIENIEGQMQVGLAPNGNALVTWSWTFDVDETVEAQAKEALAGMAPLAQEGLANYASSLAQAV